MSLVLLSKNKKFLSLRLALQSSMSMKTPSIARTIPDGFRHVRNLATTGERVHTTTPGTQKSRRSTCAGSCTSRHRAIVLY